MIYSRSFRVTLRGLFSQEIIKMKFVIASHNKNKIKEFERILEPIGVELVTADLTEAEETGKTFAENAFIKAESACKETGLPSVADDSGLCIEYLGGEPGVYSARYAPEGLRKKTVLEKLSGVPEKDRDAYFEAAICCVFPNGDKIEASGRCMGKITEELRGDNGFGYDPIFAVGSKTFAEMSDEEKDSISHRGKALQSFYEKLNEYLKTR